VSIGRPWLIASRGVALRSLPKLRPSLMYCWVVNVGGLGLAVVPAVTASDEATILMTLGLKLVAGSGGLLLVLQAT
jgi:hypothetical protein